MIQSFFKAHDKIPVRRLGVKFSFNSNNSIPMEDKKPLGPTFGDYMASIEPTDESLEYQILFQETKFCWFEEVYVN